MSIRPLVRSFTILGLSLVTTSVAYARNPPALVRSQAAYVQASAGSGYATHSPALTPVNAASKLRTLRRVTATR